MPPPLPPPPPSPPVPTVSSFPSASAAPAVGGDLRRQAAPGPIGRNSLLESIHKGVTLRKTPVTNDRSAAVIFRTKENGTPSASGKAYGTGYSDLEGGERAAPSPGTPGLGIGLFAGGFPKLRSTTSSFQKLKYRAPPPPPTYLKKPSLASLSSVHDEAGGKGSVTASVGKVGSVVGNFNRQPKKLGLPPPPFAHDDLGSERWPLPPPPLPQEDSVDAGSNRLSPPPPPLPQEDSESGYGGAIINHASTSPSTAGTNGYGAQSMGNSRTAFHKITSATNKLAKNLAYPPPPKVTSTVGTRWKMPSLKQLSMAQPPPLVPKACPAVPPRPHQHPSAFHPAVPPRPPQQPLAVHPPAPAKPKINSVQKTGNGNPSPLPPLPEEGGYSLPGEGPNYSCPVGGSPSLPEQRPPPLPVRNSSLKREPTPGCSRSLTPSSSLSSSYRGGGNVDLDIDLRYGYLFPPLNQLPPPTPFTGCEKTYPSRETPSRQKRPAPQPPTQQQPVLKDGSKY